MAVVIIILGVYAQTHHAYRNSAPIYNHYKIKISPFKGIKTSKEKAILLNKLANLYSSNNCQKKLFIAYLGQPLLYYFFQRSAPYGISWLAPFYSNFLRNADSRSLIELLEKNKHWCVFDAQAYDRPTINYLADFATRSMSFFLATEKDATSFLAAFIISSARHVSILFLFL